VNEREAWIALASVPGVGAVTLERLLEAHGTARGTLAAIAAERPARVDRAVAAMTGLRHRPGLGRSLQRAARDPDRVAQQVATLGGWLLSSLDEAYPEPLRQIAEPPPVLYGLGDPGLLSHPRAVAVVGTRRPTAQGRDLAARITHRLAEAGAGIVSGLALGIDGIAHRSALEAGAATVAVIGSGIEQPGPALHARLARELAERGAVVSELPPGVNPTKGTFPRRNRIISGLAQATVVVEAPARSGALITAHHALEQGRAVFVAPGRLLDRSVAGSLALLRETPACLLTNLDEMVVDLGLGAAAAGSGDGQQTRLDRAGALALLEPTQRSVATALAQGPGSIDSLCRATGLAPGVVVAALTMLQLRGWATVHGGTQLPAGPLVRMDR
jgi:DNA processing protein